MTGARFQRRARLRRRAEFDRVFERPARSSDTMFTVLARCNGLGHARLGLAVSRKVSKSGVARNRIKRRIRESFRGRQGELAGIDLVVIARPGAAAGRRCFGSLDGHWNRIVARCARR